MKIGYVMLALLLSSTLSHAAHQTHMRGKRYCEIIVSESLTRYAVYNTFGLNDCPEAEWRRITVAAIKKETGASLVHLNGPRYWVIDGLEKTHLIKTAPRALGGLQMRQAGVLRLGMMDLLHAGAPYRTHDVERHTTWIYKAGKPVYELIDTKGRVFVMQSYSVQKTPQTLQSLTQLASALHLPTGWTFKQGILAKTTPLPTVNDMATVVQDDAANTYQLAPHDFL